jgi:hypothetical protein
MNLSSKASIDRNQVQNTAKANVNVNANVNANVKRTKKSMKVNHDQITIDLAKGYVAGGQKASTLLATTLAMAASVLHVTLQPHLNPAVEGGASKMMAEIYPNWTVQQGYHNFLLAAGGVGVLSGESDKTIHAMPDMNAALAYSASYVQLAAKESFVSHYPEHVYQLREVIPPHVPTKTWGNFALKSMSNTDAAADVGVVTTGKANKTVSGLRERHNVSDAIKSSHNHNKNKNKNHDSSSAVIKGLREVPDSDNHEYWGESMNTKGEKKKGSKKGNSKGSVSFDCK